IANWMEAVRVLLYFGIILSSVVAVLCLISGITVTMLDREVEYASLEAIGYGNGSIARIVLTEVFVQGVLAMIASVPLGIAIAYYLNVRMGATWFEIRTILEPRDFIAVLGVSFPSFFLAALPGLWHLFRLNMPEVVRKRIMG
ncbi:MAG: ABC transporter permease, partial [Vicinamibacteria bacterium]